MKLSTLAILAILPLTAHAKNIASYGDWSIWENDNTAKLHMYTSFSNSKSDFNLAVFKDGTQSIMICDRPDTPDGNLSYLNDIVVNVNKQNIKLKLFKYDGGCLTASAATKQGSDYIGYQLYHSQSVRFTLQTGDWFQFSARGVQRAWDALNGIVPRPKNKTKELFLKGGTAI